MDYSQPPYPPPQHAHAPNPPQHPHQPQQHHQNHQNYQHAAADPQHNHQSFQFNAGLPGLTQHPYAQNMQQPLYPGQSWLPPPPIPQNAFPGLVPFPQFHPQHNFPFFPPPPPGPGFFPPDMAAQNMPVPATNAPNAQPAPFAPPQQPRQIITDRLVEMVDLDKEEGELSEGDAPFRGGAPPRGPAALARAFVPPPRSAPATAPVDRWGTRQRDSDRPNASTAHRQPTSTTNRDEPPRAPNDGTASTQMNLPIRTTMTVAEKRAVARQFIRLLQDNNIAYPALAAEGLDAEHLVNLYQQADLPVPAPVPGPIPVPAPAPKVAASSKATEVNRQPAAPPNASTAMMNAQSAPAASPIPAVRTNVAQAPVAMVNAQAAPVAKPIPAVKTNVAQAPVAMANAQTAPVAKPIPAAKTNVAPAPAPKSAPSPIDRKSYIAKLQAAKLAKLGKQSNSGPAASASKTPTALTAAPAPAAPTAPAALVPPTALAKEQSLIAPSLPKPPQPSVANGETKEPIAKAKAVRSEEEKARQTEVIKQRLELLRAQGKLSSTNSPAPQAAANTGPVAPPTTSQPASMNVENPGAQHPQAAPNFSKIPGLFMSTSSPVKAPPMPAQKDSGAASLKRPVASDFDDVSTPSSFSGPAYTRPLGQSPHEHVEESMIIEVSEDESGGSQMDLDDDQADLPPASTFSPPHTSHNGTKDLRHFPPLSDFPPRSGSARQASSAFGIPSAVRTPASYTAEEISIREQENKRQMENLKLKIAEMTRKKKTTVAKKQEIGSPAPPKPDIPVETKQTAISPQISTGPTRPVPSPPSAASVQSNEWKKQRRAEIEFTLRSLDTELDDDNASLARLEREVAKIKAKKEQYQRNRERLLKELEGYGIDTNGMPNEELQAQKDIIDLQHDIENDQQSTRLDSPALRPVQNTGAIFGNGVSAQSANYGPGQDRDLPATEDLPPLPSSPVVASAQSSTPREEVAQVSVTTDIVMADDVLEAAVDPVLPQDIDLQSKEQEAVPAETHPEPLVGTATPLDEDGDFYSPEPVVLPVVADQAATVESVPAVTKAPRDDDVEMSHSFTEDEGEGGEEAMSQSSSEEEEEAMSQSSSEEEEEYEPEEPEPVANPIFTAEIAEMQVARPTAQTTSPLSIASSEDEGEVYEPPEPTQIMSDIQSGAPDHSASEIQSHDGTDDQDDMDMSIISSDESDESDDAQESSSEKASEYAESWTNQPIADDLAPELQSSELPNVAEQSAEADAGIDVTRFVPYQSPLRMFKSYRYHPSYPRDVAGGFLSLTYSHQIDPQRPLCRFESVGGTCNDTHCEGQHFRDMNISGDKLLVQLGTGDANPGKTPEERNRWNDGLRVVLKELRQKSIKDPPGIATEIARYRRQFFNDDTRVVNM